MVKETSGYLVTLTTLFGDFKDIYMYIEEGYLGASNVATVSHEQSFIGVWLPEMNGYPSE